MKAFAFGLGLCVFCIGVSCILGYALSISRLYNWDNGVGMSLASGVAFLFTGFAVCILASRTHEQICAT